MAEKLIDGANLSEPAKSLATDRRLILKSSLATLAAVGTGTLATIAKAQPFATSNANMDAEILNFALNLEYLEAEFYLRAVYGEGLGHKHTSGVGKAGTVTGGAKVNFQNDAIHQYAKEIAEDERNHVTFLRGALGDSAVAEPSIDLQHSFNVLSRAAGLGDKFDPFANETNFILGAFIFEDVGVTAYHGAARSISNKDYLDAAAGILAVEAYHAGIVRLLCYQAGLSDQANAISALRNKLSAAVGSPATTDQGIVINGQANLVPTDSNSIAFDRTTKEVLNIVYSGGKSKDYGFYPDKMNGAIH